MEGGCKRLPVDLEWSEWRSLGFPSVGVTLFLCLILSGERESESPPSIGCSSKSQGQTSGFRGRGDLGGRGFRVSRLSSLSPPLSLEWRLLDGDCPAFCLWWERLPLLIPELVLPLRPFLLVSSTLCVLLVSPGIFSLALAITLRDFCMMEVRRWTGFFSCVKL
ncbi:hypothetical protein EYF80_008201 [Liparis tanakae]|uniref:Uncharacterized protein n=1 Tax=Liparis tanakae TaxID=230148 RepID=A0A4Z2ITT9_9TELE|nr:hypothetical protein EYF80_008201 [Liparis tanakae]